MYLLPGLLSSSESPMSKLRRRTCATTPSTEGDRFRLRRTRSGVIVGFFILALVCGETVLAQSTSKGIRNDPSSSVLNDPILVEEGRAGLMALYDMRFEEADSIFSRIESQFAGHPVGPFLKALVIWWRILPVLEMGPTTDDDLFYNAMESVIRLSDELLDANENNFDAMFFKGAALGFRGRLRSNRQEWLAAALDGRATLDYIFKIADADTTNADFQFGRGVYDYFASVIPERYPIVKPMMVFFPNADKKRGLKNLAFTAEKGHFIQTEAVYFLLQIYLSYDRDYDGARKHVEWLRTQHPQNALFHVLDGRVFATWSRWDRAVEVFREVIDLHERGATGYNRLIASQAHYFIGRFDMLSGRLEEAIIQFDRVIDLSKVIAAATYFNLFATLRRGMIYDTRGERESAIREYERVLDMKDRGGAHERAKRYRKAPYAGAIGSS
ncbi:MAG: tetratricopeptide repeat protein [Bacteroidetes bacterium]|nr:MAG: tetratricopeptide repeat protein [Bacteroidota bacterium]